MKKKSNNIKLFCVITAIAILVLIDQILKKIFDDNSIELGNLISIKSSLNLGSAFGMFSSLDFYNFFVIFLSIFIIIGLYLYKEEFFIDKLTTLVYVLLLSGIVGNFLDRVLIGAVRDFIFIHHMFIFNIADAYLFIGVFLYMIISIENLNRVH